MGCGGSEEKEEAVDCEGGVENEEVRFHTDGPVLVESIRGCLETCGDAVCAL